MGPEALFEEGRAWFRRYLRTVLEEAEPITADNVSVVELALMDAEVDAARRALDEAGPPAHTPGEPRLVQQLGTRCMSTSLANAMITFGEGFFRDGGEEPVHRFTQDVVERTSAMGKPGDYRSVDDLFKYLESDRLLELELDGVAFAGNYRVRLTGSLLDVCEALWTGRGRLVVQRRAHAYLGYGLEVGPGGEPRVLFRDPMRRTGPGADRISLDELRRDFLWSPLKKIPALMGPHAFPSLTSEALIGHLDRYEGMENLGVECPSALVYRAEDAPPLHQPPEPERGVE